MVYSMYWMEDQAIHWQASDLSIKRYPTKEEVLLMDDSNSNQHSAAATLLGLR
jgi:hypothetical protein